MATEPTNSSESDAPSPSMTSGLTDEVLNTKMTNLETGTQDLGHGTVSSSTAGAGDDMVNEDQDKDSISTQVDEGQVASEQLDLDTGANASGSSSTGIMLKPMNCRVFVSNIPKTKTQTELMHEFGQLTSGLKDVIVYKDGELAYAKNRGFCFLDYESPEHAKEAKRVLSALGDVMGCTIRVDDADPEVVVDEEVMKNARCLYVKNLGPTITQSALEQLFASHGHQSVRKVKFDERQKAEKAMLALDRTWMDGSLIEIEWARPPVSKNQRERILRARENRRLQFQRQFSGSAEPRTQLPKPAAVSVPIAPAPASVCNYYSNMATTGNVGMVAPQLNAPVSGLPYSTQARSYNDPNANGHYYPYVHPFSGTTFYQNPQQQQMGLGYGHTGYQQAGTAPALTNYNQYATNYPNSWGGGQGQSGHHGHGHGRSNPSTTGYQPQGRQHQQRYGNGTGMGKQRTY